MEFAPPFLLLTALFVGVAYAQSRKLRSGLAYVMRKSGQSSLGHASDNSNGRLIGR